MFSYDEQDRIIYEKKLYFTHNMYQFLLNVEINNIIKTIVIKLGLAMWVDLGLDRPET